MNFDNIYNGILENFNVPELFLDDRLTTLEFRLNKNHYHFKNIQLYIQENYELNEEFIYFELENLIINIRSTLDNLLQLINISYKMGFKDININVRNILRHKSCTNALKDIFLVHTHPKNQFWNFIYTTRNEIVHEVCIKSQLPLVKDEDYINGELVKKISFVNKNGDKENLMFFYKQCIKLIDELTDGALYVLSNGLN